MPIVRPGNKPLKDTGKLLDSVGWCPSSAWKDGDVQLDTSTGLRKVKAKVLGGLSVQPHLQRKDWWSVTHVGTGLQTAAAATESDALRIAELLWSRVCLAYRLGTVEEVLARLPEWIKAWVWSMRDGDGRWTDPTPFQEGKV